MRVWEGAQPQPREGVPHTFRSALRPVRLHGDVRVEVVQRTVGLLAAVPPTLVHALDLFVASAGALVLLGPGDGDEGVNLSPLAIEDSQWPRAPDPGTPSGDSRLLETLSASLDPHDISVQAGEGTDVRGGARGVHRRVRFSVRTRMNLPEGDGGEEQADNLPGRDALQLGRPSWASGRR
jgi:hypothetical protein